MRRYGVRADGGEYLQTWKEEPFALGVGINAQQLQRFVLVKVKFGQVVRGSG